MNQNPDTRRLPASAEGIAEAAAILGHGGLVAFPTETVWGLGADARNGRAVARIYEAKGRPSFNPLIVHVAGIDAARALVAWDETADRLARAFWPGPLTLVLPLRDRSGISELVTAGLPTLAVRVPAAPIARDLLSAFGGPVAAPSANPSGRISPTRPEHVLDGLGGRIEAVLEGPPCEVGLESTIVSLAGGAPQLLRPGGLPAEALAAALGTVPGPAPDAGRVTAPGQLASHYAPAARLRLDATEWRPGEARLGFGSVEADINLSPAGDLREAAANLFAALHELDRGPGSVIAVSPIPHEGLGLAINDRLRRAAAPRRGRVFGA